MSYTFEITNRSMQCFEPYEEHIGVDYESTDPNGNILAAASGTVEKSELSTIYGDIITLRHLDGKWFIHIFI